MSSIYKLKGEEVQNMAKEFNSTNYGLRARLFSVLPFLLGSFCMIIMFVDLIIFEISGAVEMTILDLMYILIPFGIALTCFSIGCITQLQYVRMLKEYAESKKKFNIKI